MTSDDRQRHEMSPRTAWILYLRREALRMDRAEVSTIAHVGIIYATFADWDGTSIHPGVGTLATITGKSEDTVSRCLTALTSAGLIERKRRQGGKTATAHLLAPLTETTDWEPLLLPFSETRQAAYRRRQKSKAAAEESANRTAHNPSGDGFKNPSPSGDLDTVPVGGTEDSRTRPRTGQQPVPGRVAEPVPVGGVRIPSSTSGRDTHTDREMPGLVAQPQVRAPEAEDKDESPPGLQALDGGGRGGGGQAPLLLSVHSEPAAPPDLGRIADHMSALYGVVLPRRYAAPVALQILGDLDDLPDPTAYVVAALDADPARYRPPLPDAVPAPTRRAASDS